MSTAILNVRGIPAWTADDEENWQEMMGRAAEAKRRLQPSPTHGQFSEAARSKDVQNRSMKESSSARQALQPQPAKMSWQQLKRWYDEARKRDAEAVPSPPAPRPPGLAPEFWDTAKINKLRGYQAAGIITNEDHDVLPGASSPQSLQAAKVAQAHAIINADRNFGDLRAKLVRTASDEIKDSKLAKSEQYRQALDAVRTARQEDLRGIDPVGGRMHFNNRYNSPAEGKKFRLNTERVAVSQTHGPFLWRKTPTYIMVYDNTKDEERRLERKSKEGKK